MGKTKKAGLLVLLDLTLVLYQSLPQRRDLTTFFPPPFYTSAGKAENEPVLAQFLLISFPMPILIFTS